ncbi:hypothetical protein I3760_08G074300 [Carya illinoinensis]|nr:hypothetical protein I3760_08G074300 [Carya illinoinensis]
MPATLDIIPLYATLLKACSSAKTLQNLKRIHYRTIILGISHHDFLRTKLISSYASYAQLHHAYVLFFFATRQPTFLFNTLIRVQASLGLFSHSLFIFRKMLIASKSIDCYTLPPILKSFLVNGLALDTTNLNALITMYAKCGDLVSVCKVFDEMSVRNEISWSTMMVGYGMNGIFNEVFQLFDRMVEVGERHDGDTFTVLLTSCSHGGWRLGVRLGLQHYTSMVDMLGRAGQVEEVEKLILEMEVEPNEALWRALLGACRIHGKVEVAERVAKKV